MILSFNSPTQIYQIREGTLHSITRITSKREPLAGDCLQLYYKHNYQNTIEIKNRSCVVCIACVLSKAVTGRKCPYYESDTYSIDVLCPQFQNFLGYGKVNAVINYDNFEAIPCKNEWATNHGFSTVDDARCYYSKLMGEAWESYPLTVISWDYLGKTQNKLNNE